MQVVILAGGKGTRLRPITYTIPKPMIEVFGKPFLEYQVDLVKSHGVKDILILAGYLGGQIEEYFGNGIGYGLDIRYSYEKKLMGTAGALKNAQQMLQDQFILLNGDTLLQIDYNYFFSCFKNSGKTSMVVAYDNRENLMPNNLKVNSKGAVVVYDKQNDHGMTHIDAGAIAYDKKVLQLIPEQQVYSLETQIYPRLIETGQIEAFVTDKRFYDMGSIKGLKDIEQALI